MMKTFFLLYLLLLNLCGFYSMGIDKQRAKKHQWRIREKTLFLFALLGGCAGSLIGMYVFHHKTKHWYFVIFLPCILLVQVILLFQFFF